MKSYCNWPNALLAISTASMMLLWPALMWAASAGDGSGDENMAEGIAALAVLAAAYLLAGITLVWGSGLAVHRRIRHKRWPTGSLLLIGIAVAAILAPILIAWGGARGS